MSASHLSVPKDDMHSRVPEVEGGGYSIVMYNLTEGVWDRRVESSATPL